MPHWVARRRRALRKGGRGPARRPHEPGAAAPRWSGRLAVKRSLGKLDAPADFAARLLGAGAQPLPVTVDHAAAVEELPWHHRDPFDRILVAQVAAERAALVTADPAVHAYGIAVIW